MVGGGNGREDDQVGGAECQAEYGAARASCAALQRETAEDQSTRPEDEVEGQQTDQAQYEGGDGLAVGVADTRSEPHGLAVVGGSGWGDGAV